MMKYEMACLTYMIQNHTAFETVAGLDLDGNSNGGGKERERLAQLDALWTSFAGLFEFIN